jgi:hypothetical protein
MMTISEASKAPSLSKIWMTPKSTAVNDKHIKVEKGRE